MIVMSNGIFTIGHSNHEIEAFLRLLESQSIEVLADVRSSPYSRMVPQFNREPLRAVLQRAGVKYAFMGDSLGGKPNDPTCFKDGQVQYDRVARLPAFSWGLDRLMRGVESHRIALMCAEKDPIMCHRMLLVSRSLFERGIDVRHILADGGLESQREAEERMMDARGVPHEDFFEPHSSLLNRAYALQSRACAFALREAEADAPVNGIAS